MDPSIQWRRRFAADRDRNFWRVNTLQFIEQIRTLKASSLRPAMKNYVYWIDSSAKYPARVDAKLLAAFIDGFAQLAANLGEPDGAGVVTALDQAIELSGDDTEATSRLYIAKARYYRTLTNENAKRHSAISAAISHANPGSVEWAEAMLELSGYYSDISQYKKSMSTVAELRSNLTPDLLSAKYECGAKVREAAAQFGTFRRLSSIDRAMQKAIGDYGHRISEDDDLVRWVAMAYYYRGRVADTRRRYIEALAYYLKGIEVRNRGTEDLRVMGFFHIRIAELLMAAGDPSNARDHLDYAAHLYRACSNQSSGWLQTCLGYASLAAIAGQYDAAVATAQETQMVSRRLGYWRGELLSLGYLLALHVRHKNIEQVVKVMRSIILTARYGELNRNSIIRILAKMPSIVLKRISQQRRRRRQGGRCLVACSCRLHSTSMMP